MSRFLGIFLALVLAGAAIPAASSYQEDHSRPVFQNHDKFSFNGFSNQTQFPFEKFQNRTQFSFGGFSNQTQFQFNGSQNQTNHGQDISYLIQEINHLKQEIANAIKEQQKDKFHEQFRQDVSANKTSVQNPGHGIMIPKMYFDARGYHLGIR
ncbi:MAG: hypothetical protein WCC52_08340 [Nitrosotalea sp.]